MSGLGTLLRDLVQLLPLKVVIGIAVALALGLAPYWIESLKDRQIRGAVRQMVRAPPDERDRLTERIFTLTANKPNRLNAAIEGAIRYDQRALRDEALSRLEAAGAGADAARIRKRLAPEKVKVRDPLEALVRIENLYRTGLTEAADEQLAQARAAFPDDLELAAFVPPAPDPKSEGPAS